MFLQCQRSYPLSFIINWSFEQGTFPESLKTAKVKPNHKKEDTVTTALYLYYQFSGKY